MKSLNYNPSPVPSPKVPPPPRFSFHEEWFWNKAKDFINDFYTDDFPGIILNDGSPDKSDIEIDL